MPPAQFGVTFADLRFSNGAVAAEIVERWTKQIIQDRTVILHGGRLNLQAFKIEPDVFGRSKVVDTQDLYRYVQKSGPPGLGTLARVVLGRAIQLGGHSPVQDARATLELWLMKNTYDRDVEMAKTAAERAKEAAQKELTRAHAREGGGHKGGRCRGGGGSGGGQAGGVGEFVQGRGGKGQDRGGRGGRGRGGGGRGHGRGGGLA